MREGPSIVRLSSVLGDRARAEMLTLLMSGRALTATELALAAGITKQTASSHLKQLLDSQLLTAESHGRHRYFRIARPEVAQLLETMLDLSTRVVPRVGPRDEELRKARVCYDHLAGEIAVTLFERLQQRGAFLLDGAHLDLSSMGRALLLELGIDVSTLVRTKRVLCRACMDWSERRHHLAGAVGAALWARLQELGWARVQPGSRVVRVDARHERNLQSLFKGTGA